MNSEELNIKIKVSYSLSRFLIMSRGLVLKHEELDSSKRLRLFLIISASGNFNYFKLRTATEKERSHSND